MSNVHNNWRKFLAEGSYTGDKLLREIDEDELSTIQGVIDEMGPEDLPFNELFNGKERMVIPFASGDPKSDLGRFLGALTTAGEAEPLDKAWTFVPSWEKGVMEKERPMGDKALADMILGGDVPEMKYDTIKVGKWLRQTEIALIAMADWRKYKVDNMLGSGERPMSKEELEKEKRLRNKLQSLTGVWSSHGIVARFKPDLTSISRPRYLGTGDRPQDDTEEQWYRASANRVAELSEYWKQNAKYIKENPQGELSTNTYSIVLTRNPIDVLRMSDFDDIVSCHSPPSRERQSESYFRCAIAEAHGEGAIAYVVKNEDLEAFFDEKVENITLDDFEHDELFYDDARDVGEITPLARVRLRLIQYGSSGAGIPQVDIAVPEVKVYGEKIPGLAEAVMSWAKEAQGELISKITKDGKGTVNFSRFIAMGGSYEDNTREGLLLKLLGIGRNMKMGNLHTDVSTEQGLDTSMLPGPENEAAQLLQDANEYLAGHSFSNFNVSHTTDYDESAWITPDVKLRLEWDTDEWKSLPNPNELRHVPDELSGYGDDYAFLSDYGISVYNFSGNIVVEFNIDVARVNADEMDSFYSAEDYDIFLDELEKMEDYGGTVGVIKHVVEQTMKREGHMEGGAIIRLGYEVQNDEHKMYEWDWHVEEGGDDPFDHISAEVRMWLSYGDIPDEVVKKIFSTREFWLEIRKRMHAPIHQAHVASRGEDANKYYVDIEKFIGEFDEDTNEVEFKLNYSVGFDDPDDTVEIFQQMIEHWDDEDLLYGLFNKVLKEYAAQVADLTPMEDPESDMNESKKVSGDKLFNNWRAFLSS